MAWAGGQSVGLWQDAQMCGAMGDWHMCFAVVENVVVIRAYHRMHA